MISERDLDIRLCAAFAPPADLDARVQRMLAPALPAVRPARPAPRWSIAAAWVVAAGALLWVAREAGSWLGGTAADHEQLAVHGPPEAPASAAESEAPVGDVPGAGVGEFLALGRAALERSEVLETHCASPGEVGALVAELSGGELTYAPRQAGELQGPCGAPAGSTATVLVGQFAERVRVVVLDRVERDPAPQADDSDGLVVQRRVLGGWVVYEIGEDDEGLCLDDFGVGPE